MGQISGMLGKRDPSATNDVMGGQAVATGTPGAQTVADPNQGLSGGQMFGRKAISGSLARLGNGLQQQGQQQGGQAMPIQVQQQQQPNFLDQWNQQRKNSLFYGGGQ